MRSGYDVLILGARPAGERTRRSNRSRRGRSGSDSWSLNSWAECPTAGAARSRWGCVVTLDSHRLRQPIEAPLVLVDGAAVGRRRTFTSRTTREP